MSEWIKPYKNKGQIRITLCFTIAFLVCSLTGFAQQNRKELEEKRKKLLKEIEQTTVILRQTTENKEATLSTYLTLQKQIGRRQQLISTLQTEVQYLLENLERTSSVVISLTEDIDRLEQEYAKMARHAYRQHLSRSNLLFLFSAKNFNDAFRRWQYLRQYDRYRLKQTRLILETRQALLDKIKVIEERKAEKEKLLDTERRQSQMLGLEVSAKNRLLEELKGNEARLARELEAKQNAAAKLNTAIENIIREEMERARREERSTASTNKNVKPSATPESVISSKEFQSNRGKLPWPVKNGVITGHFGRQSHPTIQSVEIVNNGIDIRTDAGAPVRAVFDGTVVGTQFIPGYNYMVIIKHGDYYTVYSNLEELTVKKGDEVTARQGIGKVSIDRKTNTSEVHFEIWKEKTRLNPQDWVGSK